jgi:hypothetical protein
MAFGSFSAGFIWGVVVVIGVAQLSDWIRRRR